MKRKQSNKDIKTMLIKCNDFSIINAESLFTAFLTEHNVLISISNHAGPLFQKMFPDSNIAAKHRCTQNNNNNNNKNHYYEKFCR